jgi:hypothetical protein
MQKYKMQKEIRFDRADGGLDLEPRGTGSGGRSVLRAPTHIVGKILSVSS